MSRLATSSPIARAVAQWHRGALALALVAVMFNLLGWLMIAPAQAAEITSLSVITQSICHDGQNTQPDSGGVKCILCLPLLQGAAVPPAPPVLSRPGSHGLILALPHGEIQAEAAAIRSPMARAPPAA